MRLFHWSAHSQRVMSKRRLIFVASLLLLLQASTIACLHGQSAAAILSDMVQISLGVTGPE